MEDWGYAFGCVKLLYFSLHGLFLLFLGVIITFFFLAFRALLMSLFKLLSSKDLVSILHMNWLNAFLICSSINHHFALHDGILDNIKAFSLILY